MYYKWYILVIFLILALVSLPAHYKRQKDIYLKSGMKACIKDTINEGIGCIFASVIFGAIIFFFVSVFKTSASPTIFVEERRIPIVALSDSKITYLRKYSSSNKTVYNYAVKEILGKTPYSIESSGGNVSIDDTLSKDQQSELIIYKGALDKNVEKSYWNLEDDVFKYVFRVPTGTFDEKFEVNME
jgi:hypothetical protein